jgi:hypothetical protein
MIENGERGIKPPLSACACLAELMTGKVTFILPNSAGITIMKHMVLKTHDWRENI